MELPPLDKEHLWKFPIYENFILLPHSFPVPFPPYFAHLSFPLHSFFPFLFPAPPASLPTYSFPSVYKQNQALSIYFNTYVIKFLFSETLIASQLTEEKVLVIIMSTETFWLHLQLPAPTHSVPITLSCLLFLTKHVFLKVFAWIIQISFCLELSSISISHSFTLFTSLLTHHLPWSLCNKIYPSS